MTLTLPIPDKALSPNARIHAIKKSTITRHARQTAFFQTLAALGVRSVPTRILAGDRRKLGITHAKPLRSADYQRISTLLLPGQPPAFTSYSLAFHFPQERNRDDDNAAASCKAYRDGIADALRIDDSTLRIQSLTAAIDRTNPRLEITLHEKSPDAGATE
jgi:crossover junction endodeoxyribonuclease RusA